MWVKNIKFVEDVPRKYMNDFTKEELIDLSVIIGIWNVKFNHPTDKETLNLQDKILSMIDNYCKNECRNPCEICGYLI